MITWHDLNARQRVYLQALYDADQATEQERRTRAAGGQWDRTPAREWRYQLYGPTEPPSPLYRTLSRAGLVDPGTGATWQALEDRHLCQCRYRPDAFGGRLLDVQITPAGRRLVRAATGEPRVQTPPRGQLRERQWAALALIYAAGDLGMDSDTLLHAPGGFDWWATLRRLTIYRPQPLIAQRRHVVYTITPAGRAWYAAHYQVYRERYPQIDAPQPQAQLDTEEAAG